MKVVVAVDGSKYGRWAVQWIGGMPLVKRPAVTALHVVDLAALRAPFVSQPAMIGYEVYLQAEKKRLENRAKKAMAETTALLKALKLRGTVTMEKGHVAPAILAHAGGRGGLVALGNRGLGNFDRLFLGSVSAQVTLHAPCSVLVVKQPPRPIRQVLLAVDGSKASDHALHFLLHEVKPAKNVRIEVTVLYVLPPFAYSEAAVAGINLAHRYADKLAAAGYRVKEAYMPGDPADEIVAAAKSRRVDLVVAGAKGLSAVGRFLLGSVSTKLVRHCPCSILVVR
ncbi:MAG: universal stress protein [Nitrospirae bacterium]|nr:universal stress protein [Nitrospirota bacterium]